MSKENNIEISKETNENETDTQVKRGRGRPKGVKDTNRKEGVHRGRPILSDDKRTNKFNKKEYYKHYYIANFQNRRAHKHCEYCDLYILNQDFNRHTRTKKHMKNIEKSKNSEPIPENIPVEPVNIQTE